MASANYEIKSHSFGWRSCQNIKKKAMDQEFSWTGLALSLSIAFFMVLISAYFLNSLYSSVSQNEKENNIFSFENFVSVPVAQAAVPTDYKGEIKKWTDNINIKEGEEKVYSVEIKNIGQEVWPSGTSWETGPFLRSSSQLEHPDWLSNYKIVELGQEIQPGETISFRFKLKAPNGVDGMIQQNFQLVRNRQPIQGTDLRLLVDIEGERQDEKVEEKEQEIAQTNNNKPSAFNQEIKKQDKSDENKNVDETDHKNKEKTEENKGYLSEESQELQKEKKQKKEDIEDIKEKITLTEEPLIRVGLFSTTKSHRIKSQGYFDVYSGDKLILSGVSPRNQTVVGYSSEKNKYFIGTNSFTKFVQNPVRLVPREKNSIMTLLDYKDLAGWNEEINYNSFRNIIEFRHVDLTDKLWVINELPIDYYLRGLAETSEYSSLEFQKTLATAARTYTMYHYNRGVEHNIEGGSTKHGVERFHVHALYDQVYKGYESEKIMPKLTRAINETKGVVVTHNNKVVVTPYFSRSDGRTRSWEEVWYGDPKPWLQSVSVPREEGESLWGHGVGMSARGALLMIREDNYTWKEVLEHFYQNTHLHQIYK